MKSRPNPTSVPQNQSAPAQSASYAPSVPISIYRELAAELDATRALLETVHTENQHLQQQNQQLRQEIDRLVQSALTLRSYTESSGSITSQFSEGVIAESIPAPAGVPSARPAPTSAPTSVEEFESVAAQLRGNAADPTPEPPIASPSPEGLIASTQVAEPPQMLTSETKPKGLGGLWLFLTVIAIVVSAFGAGFFMVKPLLQNR